MTVVERLRATAVQVARRAELLPKTAHGEVSHSEYVVLELWTADGVLGLGEVTSAPGWNGEEWAGTLALLERVAPIVIGADLRDWGALAARLDRAVRGRPFLRAGIEMACLDALGRTLGVPVATLLGGALRSVVPTKIVIPAREPSFVRDATAKALERGARALKVKVGVEADVERVAAVRDVAGPDVPIVVDANEGWTGEQADARVVALTGLGVRAFEQPLRRQAWRASADLRRRTGALLVGDESIWQLTDLLRAEADGAFDIASIYPGKCGGMLDAVALARVAAAIGLMVSYGSNLELGIGTAALVHAAACSPALSTVVPSDAIGPLYFETSMVTDASFVAWHEASLPGSAGLGVELDHDALAACRIAGTELT